MKPRWINTLRMKFAVIAALVMGLFSAAWGHHLVGAERAHLMAGLQGNGRVILASLKAPIINTMLLQELGIVPDGLDNFVDEIVSTPDLPAVYAFITDADGNVLAHNVYDQLGSVKSDPLTRAVLRGETFVSTVIKDRNGNDTVLDLGLPLKVGGKRWGALRVGLSMLPMQRQFASFQKEALLFSVLLFLGGTAVFFVVGITMSRPLERLALAMTDVKTGSLHPVQPGKRKDEIGVLESAFYDMVARLKAGEEERQRTLSSLIQFEKMATLGRIVAGVSHEIYNPLGALSACLFTMEAKVPPQLRSCTDIFREGINRIEGIVSQLLDFSRVCELELAPASSQEFMAEAVKFARMALKRDRILLHATDDFPPAVIRMDKGKLHQAVLNLVVNAADASPPDGVVTLAARGEGGWYILEVTDQGEGIEEDKKQLIFDIFYTTKPQGEGTGIGLAVTKSIVELHGGTISFESRPGETTFVIRIPV